MVSVQFLRCFGFVAAIGIATSLSAHANDSTVRLGAAGLELTGLRSIRMIEKFFAYLARLGSRALRISK